MANFNKNELIEEAKKLLKNEISTISYNTWIKDLEILEINQNNFVIPVKNEIHKNTLETQLNDLFTNTFNYLTNMECTFTFVFEDQKNNVPIETSSINVTQGYENTNLRSEFTFDTFVVGNNNSFAHAAALAVAEAPGTAYNPLFMYGGVGLGKTHLMHAIGNEILKINPSKKVIYVSSEKFTNDFIDTVQKGNIEAFRNKYRTIDVLLIDDIQFIDGKERTQEEFFHTFNTLFEEKKQIVVCSDRPPRDMLQLEERLKSRFEGGLLVDISLPDYETRYAILRKKAEENHMIIDDEILSNIALKIDSNVRDLEGVLKKLFAIATFTHSPITVEVAEKAINDVILQKEKVISADYVQEIVSRFFNIDKKDLKGPKRSNDVAFPRQIAMYLCRETANMSFPQIGNEFGKRDHTTVMHAYSKIESEIKNNPTTKLTVESVKKILLENK